MDDESYESALVAELQALANVPPGTGSFAIRCSAGTVTVVYKQFSSSPSELTLEARYDDVARVVPTLPNYRDLPAGAPVVATRPMDIHLRHEDGEDRAAKDEGLNVEWQTGDRAFDEAVYVSTPGHGAEVLSAVLGPDVRGAVMSLFGLGFRKVSIDDHGVVRLELTEFVVTRPREGRGRDAMDAFGRLLTNLPVVTASGASHAPIPFARTTAAFSYTALFFGLVFFFSSVVPFVYPSIVETPLRFASGAGAVAASCVAIALGILGFRVAKKIHGGRVASRMRGSSRAAVTADRAGISAGLCALFVVASIIQATLLVMFELWH